MFHPLDNNLIAGIELPELFTNPFEYQPHPLVEMARGELCRYVVEQEQWRQEIEAGKMFGVLVVQRHDGALGFLAAFSGYLAKKTLHEYFVPPIVNLLDPNGFFAIEEAEISKINQEVARIENDHKTAELRSRLAEIEAQEREEIGALREEYLTQRAKRRTLREEGCDAETLSALSAESQRQKGALRRRESYFAALKRELQHPLAELDARRRRLVEERQKRSAALQKLTFSRFRPLNARGEGRDLLTIFEHYNRTTPPAGSGECAAPKLLHYAFANGLRPVAMGEFWWGESTRGEVRRHMSYYPACRGKCHPILSYMLQGLEVEAAPERTSEESLLEQLTTIYEDEHMVVFNKPSGLPSVKGTSHTLSIQSIAEERYPEVNPNNLIVHRLDMDTSGVIIVAKSAEVQIALQQQFAEHTIRKRYIALLDGELKVKSGAVELPLILDPLDRPRQKVDFERGKPAYTHYTLLGVHEGRSRVALYPQTGRTHQLRVHCAHQRGLNMPICGDRLYGSGVGRLMLHAEQITLLHPATLRKFTLQCGVPF